MWDAGIYPLSILIAAFSGFWPYAKLLMMTVCWIIPGRILKILHRERILIVLDALGKWSLVDSFVMILMMVSFHFTLLPRMSREDLRMEVDAYVEPHYGFFAFVVATMLSLFLTHVVLYFHRKVTSNERLVSQETELKSLWYFSSADTKEKKERSTGWVLVIVLILISLGLIISGLVIDSFQFEFKGAFGYLLEILNQPNKTPYSALQLGMALPGASLSPNSVGTRFIQVSFFLFIVVMPMLFLGCVSALWLLPMSLSKQRFVLSITEIVHAWSALEVRTIPSLLIHLFQFLLLQCLDQK
jgi:hypothetical protein